MVRNKDSDQSEINLSLIDFFRMTTDENKVDALIEIPNEMCGYHIIELDADAEYKWNV